MKTHTHTRFRFRDDRGQSIVEFAIVLPILGLLIAGILQFGLAFRNYLAITDAARAGAREAVVHRSTACASARAAIQRTVSSTQWSVISSRITCGPVGDVGAPFTVSISYPFSIGVASVTKTGAFTASATERFE
jgi:Flp pilus assembly protein TadG